MPLQSTRNSAIRAPGEIYAYILLAALCYPGNARSSGEDPTASMFSLSGFGTLGVVHSSEHEADFTSTIFKPNGAGYSHDWSMDVDSLVAAQVTAHFTPQLIAVLQVISEQQFDHTHRPELEWANIKYQFTPEFSLRIGRTVLSSFLFSDTRKVAYAFPWARPPLEVYALVPINNSDGLDLSYGLQVGEWTNTARINVGMNDTKLPENLGGGRGRGKHLWAISDTAEFGPLSLHLAYERNDLTVTSYNIVFENFRNYGAQGVAIADRFDSKATPFSFLGVGASYDPGNWFLMSEWGRSESQSVLGTRSAWYISAGVRIRQVTPFITYAEAKADSLSDPGLTISALPPNLAEPATGLNAILNSLLRSKPVENTISIGGRWDLMDRADLKVQYDYIRIGGGSNGVLSNTQPGFQPGGRVGVFSATVDFVF